MDKNVLKINKISKNKDTIEINYEYGENLNDYFLEKPFFVKYNENIENIPDGIAVIPFIGNILPIIWLTNSILILDEIDKNYYESLEKVKNAYKDMYKEGEFLGEIKVRTIKDYNFIPEDKVCQLFSGGVDSVTTYISIRDQKPDLITIWGADIDIENKNGWEKVEKSVKEFAERKNIKSVLVKSNLRKNINEIKLNSISKKKLGIHWWYGIQHGIALLSIVIPYAYKNNLKTIYIPSSYSINDKDIKCASYPTIDENIKYGGNIIHEGFEYTRQDKLQLIAKYLKETNDENIKLRVCWEGKDGTNCNHCEKCLRTIIGLILEGVDPNKVGFKINKKEIKNIIYDKKIVFSLKYWDELKETLKNSDLKNENWINWLLELDIEKHNKNIRKKGIFSRLKRHIKNIFKKY